MKKLLLLGLLNLALAGCGSSDDTEELECAPLPSAIDITEMEVTTAPDNYQENTLVSFDAINLYFNATGEGVYEGEEPEPNKEYANCPTPAVVLPSSNKITALKISSSADFNSELTAGSDLADAFDVVEMSVSNFTYQLGDNDFATINELVAAMPVDAPLHMSLALNQAPEVESSHIFYIEISLDNGKQFMLETPEILLSSAM